MILIISTMQYRRQSTCKCLRGVLIFGPNSNPFTTWTPFCVGTADDNSALNAADDWRGASQSGETMAGMLATGATGHTIAGMLAAGASGKTITGMTATGASGHTIAGMTKRQRRYR